MTNRLELNWKLDGFVDEQRYYRSETPIDTNAPPTPVAILSSDDRVHIEYGLTLGKYYYTRISAYKNGVEKFSDEKKVFFGEVWTPQNLLNAPKLRTDSDNILTSNAQVTQLTDLSGNNYHFTQSTASYRPTLQFDSEINHNVIVFDGVDDDLRNLNAQALARNVSQFWSFTVYKKRSIDDNGKFRNIMQFNRGDASGGNARLGVYAGLDTSANASGFYIRPSDGSSASSGAFGAIAAQEWLTLYNEWDGVNQKTNISQNGVYLSFTATGIASTTSNTQPTHSPAMIGAGTFGTIGTDVDTNRSGFSDINLACLIVGSGSLPTVEERQKLEGWAAHKYGLIDNLPIDHPYKILVPTVQ